MDGTVTLRDPRTGETKTVRYKGSYPTDEELGDIADQLFPVAAPKARSTPLANLEGGGRLDLEYLGPESDTVNPGVLAKERFRRELQDKGLTASPPEEDSSLLSQRFGIGLAPPAGTERLTEASGEILKRPVLGALGGAREVGSLLLDAGRDTLTGGGGNLAGNADRATDLLLGFVPLRSELAAGMSGGLPAALGTYRENFAYDPIGQVLNTAGAAGLLRQAFGRSPRARFEAASARALESPPVKVSPPVGAASLPPPTGDYGAWFLAKNAENLGLDAAARSQRVADLLRRPAREVDFMPSILNGPEELAAWNARRAASLDPAPGVVSPSAGARPGTLDRARERLSKASWGALDVMSLPRAVQTAYDISAPGRQGAALSPYLLVSNPTGYARAWREMVSSLGPSDFSGVHRGYQSAVQSVRSHPDFDSGVRSGLEFATIHGDDRGVSSLGQKIPGVGASQRAYDAFMDRLRLEAFSSMKQAMGAEASPQALSDVARFVNRASGRGELGAVGKALEPLTTHGLFSARNTAARFQYLNPLQYGSMAPAARKQALKAALLHAGAVAGTLGLAHAAGAQVSLDPSTGDFGKVRVGNTRYELTGGYAPTVRFLLRASALFVGEGDPQERAQQLTMLGQQYLRNVAAPVPGLVSDALAPQFTPPGEKGKSTQERALGLFLPLVARDLADLIHGEGWAGIPKGAPSAVGVGVQTYGR